jgi:hypothetical protein
MIFLSLYALLSGVGFVVELVGKHWIAMACVGLYSACAYRGGEDLYYALKLKSYRRKFGRAVMGLLMIVIAYFLSRSYPIHLVYATIPGTTWIIVGVVIGMLSNMRFLNRM